MRSPMWFITLIILGTGTALLCGCQGNDPPEAPVCEAPSDGATDQLVDVDLSWSCDDPDGDELTYDVHFGTSATPPTVESDYTSTTYDPGVLDYTTTYYWQITAEDEEGEAVSGDIWEFTTMEPPAEWIYYDDGSFENGVKCPTYGYFAVRFTLPSGWSAARVTMVRIYLASGTGEEFSIGAYDNYTYDQGYYWPAGNEITLKDPASQNIGWYEHVVTPHIFGVEHFFVGIYHSSSAAPYLGVDEGSDCAARSYFQCDTGALYLITSGADWGIRVYAEYVEAPAVISSGDHTLEHEYQHNEEMAEHGVWLEPSKSCLLGARGKLAPISTISVR